MRPPEAPLDRRPIAARNTRPASLAARWLIRAGVSPDTISVAGTLAACAAGAMFSNTGHNRAFWLLGAALVQVRLLCNLFDGMVAVGRGIASPRGELFNEVPDRVSDTAVLCGVGWAADSLALGLAASLAAMATAYIRVLGRSMGQGSDFCGPMAKQQRMALVTALGVACAVLPRSLTTLWPTAALWVIVAGAAFTAARRLLRLSRALR